MTRDLHSAILFCAFLSSKSVSNNHLQASVCANARSTLSTLLRTSKERRKQRSQRIFGSSLRTDARAKTSQLGFFDPSYIPHDYKMKYTPKSLKRATNFNSNLPTFLHPRVKKSHRYARCHRFERLHPGQSYDATRPTVGSLLQRRDMSTEAGVRPLSIQKVSPSEIHSSGSSETSQPELHQSGDPRLRVDPFRVIEELDLDRLAGTTHSKAYLRQVHTALFSLHNIQELRTSLQIRLCLALLLWRDRWSTYSTHSATLAKARRVWNAVDHTKIHGEHDVALYHIAHAQILAFQGRLSDAAKEMEPHSSLKDELGVDLSWLVLKTYEIICEQSRLSDRPLKDVLRACVQQPQLASYITGNHGISTLSLTRTYGSSLRMRISDAFRPLLSRRSGDISPDLWYTSVAPNAPSDPQRNPDPPFDEEEHKRLGIFLLHEISSYLHCMPRSYSDDFPCISALVGMLDSFDNFKYPIPYQLKIKYSLQLNRLGCTEEAARYLNNMPTSSPGSMVYKSSALLAVAARQGDVIRALDLVETLRSSGSLQKRDIRHLILAYARAPVYELLPVKETSMYKSEGTTGSDFTYDDEIPDRISDAEEVFTKLLAPYGPSIEDHTIILDVYARRGDVGKVNSWIVRMLDAGFLPDDIPWEKALRAFAVAGNVRGVVWVLDHMQEIQLRRRKHGADGDGDGGKGVDKQHRWSNAMNVNVFNILLEFMARRRDPLGANRLWRNVVFAGLVKPDFKSAVKLLRAHAEAGHWNGVIKAWKYLENMEMKEQVAPYASSRKVVVLPHHKITVYNTVLRAFIAMGTPFTVMMGLFERMKSLSVHPDSFTYTMMIISATDSGDMDTAISLFQQMEEKEAWGRKYPPDAGLQQIEIGPSTIDYRPIYALTYLFHGYLRQKRWHKAREVYHLIERRGLRLLPLTYAVIVKSYTIPGARGDNDEGLKVAENFLTSLRSGWGDFQSPEAEAPRLSVKKERPSHDVAAYSPLMVDYVRQRKPEEVERLFEQMIQIGGDVSITGLTMLMDVYRRVGDVDGVRATWRTVLQVAMDVLKEDDLVRQISTLSKDDDDHSESSVESESLDFPTKDRYGYLRSSRALLCYPFSIFMDAVSAAGSHEEVAIEWSRLKDAGFSFDAHNWNHLVTVLVRAGEVERAFEVVEEVIIPYALSSKQLASGTRLPWETSKSEGEDSDGEEVEHPVVGETVKWGRRRVSMKFESSPARRAALEMFAVQQPDAASDFVHELKLMQGISRNWYQWKPHKSVLKTLSKALLHLESGRLVLPLLPPGMEREDAESKVQSSDQAHALLERLQTLYPRTCKLAYDQVPAS